MSGPKEKESRRSGSVAPCLVGGGGGKFDRAALERIADLFRVFAEPTRLAILQELQGGALTVGQLVERLRASQANTSKQLKTLHDAGLLERERRGTQILYSIGDPIVFSLCALACEKLNRDAQRVATLEFSI